MTAEQKYPNLVTFHARKDKIGHMEGLPRTRRLPPRTKGKNSYVSTLRNSSSTNWVDIEDCETAIRPYKGVKRLYNGCIWIFWGQPIRRNQNSVGPNNAYYTVGPWAEYGAFLEK